MSCVCMLVQCVALLVPAVLLSHHTVAWGVFSLLFVCLFVCMVTDFSAAEKDMDVKFCMHVRLLSGQVFSHLGGQRSRSPGTKNTLNSANTHTGACEWYALAACSSSVQQQ